MYRSKKEFAAPQSFSEATEAAYEDETVTTCNFAVAVRAHSRTSKKGNTYSVRSHTRNMSMPQRQFIGEHARVQQALADIVTKNLQQMSEQLAQNFNRK